jgi:flagellar hook-associated protein 3 FlgL
MRISDQMLQHGALASIRANLQRLATAQKHAATGRRIDTVSDDPVDSAQVLQLNGQLRDVDQFRRNGTYATTRLSMEDVVFTSVRDLLERARHLAMSVTSDDPADPTRQAAIVELDAIHQQVVSLANTRLGSGPLFGGGMRGTPFLQDGSYVGGATIPHTEIDNNVIIQTGHTGDVFTDAFAALGSLQSALAGGTAANIATTVSGLANAQQEVLGFQGESGAWQRQVNDTATMLGQRANQMLDRRDGMVQVDPAEALLKVSTAQNSLEQAYAVYARTMTTSLLDYLK